MGNGTEYLKSLLGAATPIFLAGLTSAGSRLVLHVPAGHDLTQLNALTAQLTAKMPSVRVSIRAHRLHKLAFPRSLEHWLKRLDIEQVVHDPTMLVQRGRALVAAAKSCRGLIGKDIRGILFEPELRTLFVLVKQSGAPDQQRKRINEVVARALEVADGQQGAADDWRPNLQVGYELPRGKFVPVDAMSASAWDRFKRMVRRWRMPSTIAIAISALTLPAAAHTSAGRLEQSLLSAQAANVKATSEYGVLWGLSLFADGQHALIADGFARSGLDRYFAEGEYVGGGKLLQFAQQQKKKKRREKRMHRRQRIPATGQVGPSPGS